MPIKIALSHSAISFEQENELFPFFDGFCAPCTLGFSEDHHDNIVNRFGYRQPSSFRSDGCLSFWLSVFDE
jgi:hypothetical protein